MIINQSQYPIQCISYKDSLQEWFTQLASCLHWNARINQKPK
ncbi:hypothetical protein A3Q56_07704 [Intoshia linei]|uniref:Uncharacterized protein n=1 Tax=Intoshia linei TaxID=1819745 RepID=A0A177ARF6_9BILA|nr:hypothetical protein A3Q56_07704 [Intoshia linei]